MVPALVDEMLLCVLSVGHRGLEFESMARRSQSGVRLVEAVDGARSGPRRGSRFRRGWWVVSSSVVGA